MQYRLVINPESDAEFVDYVHSRARPDSESTKALQALLRERYPRAVVSNGVSDPDGTRRWYVYREGRWKPT
jgi:hypothetical protein